MTTKRKEQEDTPQELLESIKNIKKSGATREQFIAKMKPAVYKSFNGYVMTEREKDREWSKILEIFDSVPKVADRRVTSRSVTDLEQFIIDMENNGVRLYFKPGATLKDDYGNAFTVPESTTDLALEDRPHIKKYFTPENMQKLADTFEKRGDDQADADYLFRLIDELELKEGKGEREG
jgi:hypothetical protein